MKGATIPRKTTPTAMLVALADDAVRLCSALLDQHGLRVVRVGHAAAAGERIAVVMPKLVVFPSTLRATELEALADRCVAVGARAVQVVPSSPEAFARLIEAEVIAALRKSLSAP